MTSAPSIATKRHQARSVPRGRQASAADHAALAALVAVDPARRDRLIEYLHPIQDALGHLPARLLVALAEAMRLPLAEVYEVATFYAHFEIVDDGEAAPPPRTIRVCESLSCALAGADRLAAELQAAHPEARVVRAPCLGQCDRAPAVMAPRDSRVPPYEDLAACRKAGGYEFLRRCLAGDIAPEAVIATLEAAGLRGMGGAGFPTGRKWRAVKAEPGPRLLAVNADEGEPGTFKDRHFIETAPHGFLQGMLLAAWAVQAEAAYIYLRDEYPLGHRILAAELAALREAGLLGDLRVELRRGAGAYICGEESAMLESIEGKRGLPRHKPPYPSQVGLFGRPTLINNVETLHWAAEIAAKGAAWWQGHGRNGHKGLRSFSVSGRVAQPGVKIAPAGITMNELLAEHCGGMAPGHRFAAYLPGGASGGILPAAMADIPLDFGTLEKHGCFIGSAAVIVLGEGDSPRDAALNLMRFFRHESCGQCTPCRVGTEKAADLMAQKDWNAPLLRDLATAMRDASICGLGQAAPNPLLSVLERFE